MCFINCLANCADTVEELDLGDHLSLCCCKMQRCFHTENCLFFSFHVQTYRKSICTILGMGIRVSINSCGGVSKILSFIFKFLCHGQGAVRRAILYADGPCCTFDL